MNKPLYIIGAGGHAKSIAEICLAANINLQAFISPDSINSKVLGLPVLPEVPLTLNPTSIQLAIAIGDNYLREIAFNSLSAKFPIECFPTLVHPSASVAFKSKIGFGSTIHQNATVGSNSTIGIFCTLNTGSNTDHDCQIGDFSSLGPGANLGGGVILGHRAVVAIGSTVRHGLTIGTDSILGAASYAHKSLKPNSLATGSPARVIRTRTAGDKYL
jgi:sugar O-acyltransferase (sialic acid O-acetyltransferase NeuD family)